MLLCMSSTVSPNVDPLTALRLCWLMHVLVVQHNDLEFKYEPKTVKIVYHNQWVLAPADAIISPGNWQKKQTEETKSNTKNNSHS